MAVIIDPIDLEFEGLYWKPTGELRWFRPALCDDSNLILQQLWERITGERQWRDVQKVFAD